VSSPTAEAAAVAKFCPSCGLCCNGVLFADVKLQREDKPERIASLGGEPTRKGRTFALPQPCACFDGKWCRIYSERPALCREFRCRVLLDVQEGRRTSDSAHRIIKGAKEQVQGVHALFSKLGCTRKDLPLTRRYSLLMSAPIDLGGDPGVHRLRAELVTKMACLMDSLGRFRR
jgi:hypothetical protein